MGVVVQGLRQKFRLLETYGPFASIEEIADCFERKPKTILSWADGSPGADPDTVPQKHFGTLLQVFAEALSVEIDEPSLQRLVFGPPSSFETRLRSGQPSMTFQSLLDLEADTQSFRLIRAKGNLGQMIETDFDRREAQYQIAPGERFRLVVEHDLRGFELCTLQFANAKWAPVPATCDLNTGFALIPGSHSDGSLAYMRETKDLGLNKFVLVACKPALPQSLGEVAAEKITLDTIALTNTANELRQVNEDKKLISVGLVLVE